MFDSLTKKQKKSVIKIIVAILSLIFGVSGVKVLFDNDSNEENININGMKISNVLSGKKNKVSSSGGVQIPIVDYWLTHAFIVAAVNILLTLIIILLVRHWINKYKNNIACLKVLNNKNNAEHFKVQAKQGREEYQKSWTNFFSVIEPENVTRRFGQMFSLFFIHFFISFLLIAIAELIVSLVVFYKNDKRYSFKEISIHAFNSLKKNLANILKSDKREIIDVISIFLPLVIYGINYVLTESTYSNDNNEVSHKIFALYNEKNDTKFGTGTENLFNEIINKQIKPEEIPPLPDIQMTENNPPHGPHGQHGPHISGPLPHGPHFVAPPHGPVIHDPQLNKEGEEKPEENKDNEENKNNEDEEEKKDNEENKEEEKPENENGK